MTIPGEPLTVAQEILRLRNEVGRLEADLALRNRILGHLDDNSSPEDIVAAMRGDLFHAVLDMMTPNPEGKGDE